MIPPRSTSQSPVPRPFNQSSQISRPTKLLQDMRIIREVIVLRRADCFDRMSALRTDHPVTGRGLGFPKNPVPPPNYPSTFVNLRHARPSTFATPVERVPSPISRFTPRPRPKHARLLSPPLPYRAPPRPRERIRSQFPPFVKSRQNRGFRPEASIGYNEVTKMSNRRETGHDRAIPKTA